MCDVVGFHNSSLYEALRASIGPLVSLLHDREDKTRANAAGALGNLVRNSGLLCRPLIEARALQVHPILCLLILLNSWLHVHQSMAMQHMVCFHVYIICRRRSVPVNSQCTMPLQCIDINIKTVHISPSTSTQLLAVPCHQVKEQHTGSVFNRLCSTCGS
jgi:hypothetical protein